MATRPLGAAHSSTSVSPSPAFPPALPLSTDTRSPLAMSEEEEEEERWECVSEGIVTPHSHLPTFLNIQPIFLYQLLSEGSKTHREKREALGFTSRDTQKHRSLGSQEDALLSVKELRFTTTAELVSGNLFFGM